LRHPNLREDLMTVTPTPNPCSDRHLAYEGTGNVRPPSAALDAEPLDHTAEKIEPDRHAAADGPSYHQRGIEVLSPEMPKIRIGDLPVVRVGDGMRVRS